MSSGVLSIAKPHRMWVICSQEDNKPFGILSGDEHSYDKLEEFIGATGVSAYIVPFVLDKLQLNNTHRISKEVEVELTSVGAPIPMSEVDKQELADEEKNRRERLRDILEVEQKEEQELEGKIRAFKERKLAEEEEERIERIAEREEAKAISINDLIKWKHDD